VLSCYVRFVHGDILLKIDVDVCLMKFVFDAKGGAHLLHWK
jgi:hypothetical protein